MKNEWHEHIMRVNYKDTDQMGVAHHGNYVSWFEIGRTEMMRDKGIAYSKMEDLGLLLPVLDLNVTYAKPARYDDCVGIYTKLTKSTAVRLEFGYEVRLLNEGACVTNTTVKKPDTNSDRELLATGGTVHMWLNKDWKPARVDKIAPDVFKLLRDVKGLQ